MQWLSPNLDRLMTTLKNQVAQALRNAANEAFDDDAVALTVADNLTLSTQPQFGHFQCNAAMRLSKVLQQKPRDIASKLAPYLSPAIFEKTEVAGPGFINLWLNPALIAQNLKDMLQHSQLGINKHQPSQRVIVDFSSPNIAKEMHVGHLRSTIIGDCIANLLEYLGDDVLRLNHIGDWGTAFGMLITFLKANHPDILSGKQHTDLSELVIWYKQAKQCFDRDETFKRQSQLQVVALQSGDKEALHAWQIICDISRQGFQRIYDLLNIKLIERGESYYNDQLLDTINALKKAGLLTESEGAQCVFIDGFQNREGEPLPLMVQKSDGGFNYASTDLAAVRHRAEVEHADRIIYVTDSGQSMHFKMVFATAELANFYTKKNTTLEHAGFGLVLGEDGKKFKTRSGDTVRLQELLDEAIERAYTILKERNPDDDKKTLPHAAKVLGLGAVKYADLSCQRINDYKFSFDRMLQFEGNTAAFILYSYVRVRSIQRKVDKPIADIAIDSLQLKHPSEINLALQLSTYAETLEKTAENLLPHYLTDYLFTTAQSFNAFFRDCRVADVPETDSRLLLCELTARCIKAGLDLLGIETLESM